MDKIMQLLFDIQNNADWIYRHVLGSHAEYKYSQIIDFDIDAEIKSAKELVKQLEVLKSIIK